MNFSYLPIFNSKVNLTTRLIDYSNVYLLPSICLFGIVTSFVCLLVSYKRNDTNVKSLDYILLNSFIDFSFLVIESFLFIIRCGILCPYGFKYMSKSYEIYIYLYIGYVLVTSQVLINIYVAYDRLTIFTGKLTSTADNRQSKIFRVYAICVLLSALLNALTYPIDLEVTPIGVFKPDAHLPYSDVLYARVERKEFQTPFMRKFLLALAIFNYPVLFTILWAISILVCKRFREHLNTRKMLIIGTNNSSNSRSIVRTTSVSSGESGKYSTSAKHEKKEKHYTLLTLVYCMKILIGNFVDSFENFLDLFSVDIYVEYGFINIIGNSLLFASHGASFFLYYFFYKNFRRKFLDLFWSRHH